MSTQFTVYTTEQEADILANKLPEGDLYAAKNIEGSDLRNLLKGLGGEFQRLESTLNYTINELFLGTTNDCITEFEADYGIPDANFTNQGTIAQRINNILIKIQARGTVTCEDYRKLGVLFGYSDITVIPLMDVLNAPPYSVPFIPKSQFVITEQFITFPQYVWVVQATNLIPATPAYNVPFQPTFNPLSFIQSFFNSLKPSYTQFIWRNK